MATFIICAGHSGGVIGFDPADVGAYLETYDPDAMGGYGAVTWTRDLQKAKLFAGMAEAMQEWMRTSTARPVRVDGRPNRPLSAYTITFEQQEDFL